MGERKGAYGSLVVLSFTSSTLLRLLPWGAREYGGYPIARFMLLELLQLPLATLPQIFFTVAYLVRSPNSEKVRCNGS